MAHNDWTLRDGRVISLLTPREVRALPNGTKIVAIDGEDLIKGEYKFKDLDETRFGYSAYGIEK